MDFESLLPGKNLCLIKKWDKFVENIIPYILMDGSINDKWCLTLIKMLKCHDITESKWI